MRAVKNRLLSASVLLLFLILLFLNCFIPWYSWYKRTIDTEEYRVLQERLEGTWVVTEYIGAAVEYHGVEMDEEYYRNQEDEIAELKDKYLGTALCIKKNNIEDFYSRSDGKYQYATYEELFAAYRQSPELDIKPPFWAGMFLLKDDTEYMAIITDKEGKTFMAVRGYYFQLERVNR